MPTRQFVTVQENSGKATYDGRGHSSAAAIDLREDDEEEVVPLPKDPVATSLPTQSAPPTATVVTQPIASVATTTPSALRRSKMRSIGATADPGASSITPSPKKKNRLYSPATSVKESKGQMTLGSFFPPKKSSNKVNDEPTATRDSLKATSEYSTEESPGNAQVFDKPGVRYSPKNGISALLSGDEPAPPDGNRRHPKEQEILTQNGQGNMEEPIAHVSSSNVQGSEKCSSEFNSGTNIVLAEKSHRVRYGKLETGAASSSVLSPGRKSQQVAPKKNLTLVTSLEQDKEDEQSPPKERPNLHIRASEFKNEMWSSAGHYMKEPACSKGLHSKARGPGCVEAASDHIQNISFGQAAIDNQVAKKREELDTGLGGAGVGAVAILDLTKAESRDLPSKKLPIERKQKKSNKLTETGVEKPDIECKEHKKVTISLSSAKQGQAAMKRHRCDEYARMAERYSQRRLDLIRRANDEIEEEKSSLRFSTLESVNVEIVHLNNGDIFPDELVASLAMIIQGSRLPLSSLAVYARDKLHALTRTSDNAPGRGNPAEELFLGPSLVCVTEKIKLIADRKAHFGVHRFPVHGLECRTSSAADIDKMEDTSPHHVWRWEISSLDLLPEKHVPVVKKARAARRKVALHYKAIAKLVHLLEKSAPANVRDNSIVSDEGMEKEKEKPVGNIEKQIRDAEERVLKFEREEETRRLLQQEKENKRRDQLKAKAEERLLQKRRKEEERAKKDEDKRLKELERALKRAKKEEEKRAKEELKRLEKEEKERKEQMDLQAQEEKKRKQRAFMAKFFTTGAKKRDDLGATAIPARNVPSPDKIKLKTKTPELSFDSQSFWRQINSESPKKNSEDRNCTKVLNDLGQTFQKSRREQRFPQKRTKTVKVSVVVTVVTPEAEIAGFGSDHCYRERCIRPIPNKYKFLRFHEDHRPFYRGTWSKPRTKLVSGRRPFGKDCSHLDYEVDSEADWEEEDCEEGESVCSAGDDDDEELLDEEAGVDTRKYNFSDGWLKNDDESDGESSADDDASIADKEEKKQWKKHLKKAKGSSGEHSVFPSWCVVAPKIGGVPLCGQSARSRTEITDDDNYVYGVDPNKALELLSCYEHLVFSDQLQICLDANPTQTDDHAEVKKDESANSTKKDLAEDDLKLFCNFVHNCILTSREKIVEEFRRKHPKLSYSRAMLIRKLDSITTKKRRPKAGVIWEVKNEIIQNLGLKCLIAKNDEESSTTIQVSNKKGTAKPVNESSASDNKQSNKKRKRITPQIVPHASAKMFAAFLKQRTGSAASQTGDVSK